MKIFNFRLVIFIIALAFGIGFSVPSLFKTQGPKVALGLDLQGGLNLLLSVNVDDVIKAKYAGPASQISFLAKQDKITIQAIKNTDNNVELTLLDANDKPKLDKILSDLANTQGLSYKSSELNYILTFTQAEVISQRRSAISQAITTIRNRLDQFGLSEPNVTQQGADEILVELPGIKTIEQENRARDLISRTAHLQLMAVDEDRINNIANISDEEADRFGDVILETAETEFGSKMLVKKVPILDGSKITDARVLYDENHQPVVSFTLDSEGAKIFGDFSGSNIGKRMAIVLDNKVYSAPVIRQRIGGGTGQISGGFSVEQASDLAITLRSGSLPVNLQVIEKRSVGPSLGQDSIRSSTFALILGFALVVGFMILYYMGAGVISAIALIVNLFIILAVMAIFGATLTLPGMAGIVLTVGIAVDANIIINERIRECLYQGESISRAISLGYINASRAIFDSNITSLIASVLLYIYGTGAIKGFAITTGIGIIASIITAIIGTQGIYEALLPRLSRSKKYFLNFGIRSGNVGIFAPKRANKKIKNKGGTGTNGTI